MEEDFTKSKKFYYNKGEMDVYLFLNRKEDKCKILCENTIIYYKLPRSRKIDLSIRLPEILNSIGNHFGFSFKLDDTAESRLRKMLDRKRRGLKWTE